MLVNQGRCNYNARLGNILRPLDITNIGILARVNLDCRSINNTIHGYETWFEGAPLYSKKERAGNG